MYKAAFAISQSKRKDWQPVTLGIAEYLNIGVRHPSGQTFGKVLAVTLGNEILCNDRFYDEAQCGTQITNHVRCPCFLTGLDVVRVVVACG